MGMRNEKSDLLQHDGIEPRSRATSAESMRPPASAWLRYPVIILAILLGGPVLFLVAVTVLFGLIPIAAFGLPFVFYGMYGDRDGRPALLDAGNAHERPRLLSHVGHA